MKFAEHIDVVSNAMGDDASKGNHVIEASMNILISIASLTQHWVENVFRGQELNKSGCVDALRSIMRNITSLYIVAFDGMKVDTTNTEEILQYNICLPDNHTYTIEGLSELHMFISKMLKEASEGLLSRTNILDAYKRIRDICWYFEHSLNTLSD